MQLRRQLDIPLADYPEGEHIFGPRTVSGRVDGVFVEVARNTLAAPTIWPDATTSIELICEVQDPGPPSNPWESAGSVRGQGGRFVEYGGQEATHTNLRSWWDAEAQDKRPARVRLRMLVSGGTVRTEGVARFQGLSPGEMPG